jgi:threonine synthase
MEFATFYSCSVCAEQYPFDSDVRYTCPKCDGNLNLHFDWASLRASFDAHGLRPVQNMWRYKSLLPIAPEAEEPVIAVGGTPLYNIPRLAADAGVREVWIKDEARNPSASLKDRAAAFIAATAKHAGHPIVTAASTGNAGAASACMGAAMDLPFVCFVPKAAPAAKIAQQLTFGARVVLVDGNYDAAFDLCTAITRERGWYNRNTGANPLTSEGKKTVSFEICEQLAHSGQFSPDAAHPTFAAPEWIAVSVGDGNIIVGVYKGLLALKELGLIDRMPRLLGVNSEQSRACYTAWAEGMDPHTMEPIPADTRADSIAADLPKDRVNAVNAIKETAGAFVMVPDAEILAAIPALGKVGIFAEPAASCAYAGLKAAVAQGVVAADASVVVLVTGSGLKDVPAAQEASSVVPPVVKPGDLAGAIAATE